MEARIQAAEFIPKMARIAVVNTPPPASVAPVSDDVWFLEDGDCMFIVEGFLFKLHRYMLSRERESMFPSLFKDASGAETEMIPLDDTAKEFRALCWIIYAMPLDTYPLLTQAAPVDVRKHLDILKLTNKYILPQTGTWAWILMRANTDAVPGYLKTCTQPELEDALRLADRCKDTALGLLDLVEAAWLERIEAGELPHAQALTVAEDVDRRTFQGLVYLDLRKQLCHGEFVATLNTGLSHFGLTEIQLSRLLFGHAMLTNMLKVPNTHRPNALVNCPHRGSCRAMWETFSWDQRSPLSFGEKVKEKGINFPCFSTHLNKLEFPTRENVAEFFLGKVMVADQESA